MRTGELQVGRRSVEIRTVDEAGTASKTEIVRRSSGCRRVCQLPNVDDTPASISILLVAVYLQLACANWFGRTAPTRRFTAIPSN